MINQKTEDNLKFGICNTSTHNEKYTASKKALNRVKIAYSRHFLSGQIWGSHIIIELFRVAKNKIKWENLTSIVLRKNRN